MDEVPPLPGTQHPEGTVELPLEAAAELVLRCPRDHRHSFLLPLSRLPTLRQLPDLSRVPPSLLLILFSLPLSPNIDFSLLGFFFKGDLIAFLRLLQSGALPRNRALTPKLSPALAAALACIGAPEFSRPLLGISGPLFQPHISLCMSPSRGRREALDSKREEVGC